MGWVVSSAAVTVKVANAQRGFKEFLTEKLGDKVQFNVQNAQGEQTNCTTIVNQFVSSKVDLIMANATNAVKAAY